MRDLKTRKQDVLAALEAQQDLWLATSDAAGRPHLIAVSAWWDGVDLVVATSGASRTARNLETSRGVRLASGTPGDAIMIDARVAKSRPAGESDALAKGFAEAVGWDPREVGPGWVFFTLTPVRIQAYRGYGELEGREIMNRSEWLA